MAGKYAKGTTVAPEKTRGDIEKELIRFGATRFGYLTGANEAVIAFEYQGMGLRFTLPLPSRSDSDIKYANRGRVRSESAIETAYQAEVRRRWRSLYAVIKAKLTGVEDGIESFEQAFLAYFNVGSHTLGEHLLPRLQQAVASGDLDLPLMLRGKHDGA